MFDKGLLPFVSEPLTDEAEDHTDEVKHVDGEGVLLEFWVAHIIESLHTAFAFDSIGVDVGWDALCFQVSEGGCVVDQRQNESRHGEARHQNINGGPDLIQLAILDLPLQLLSLLPANLLLRLLGHACRVAAFRARSLQRLSRVLFHIRFI